MLQVNIIAQSNNAKKKMRGNWLASAGGSLGAPSIQLKQLARLRVHGAKGCTASVAN